MLLGILSAIAAHARPAAAQAVLERRTPQYWLSHAFITTGSAILGISAMYQKTDPMDDPVSFGPDRSVVENYSLLAPNVSDVLVTSEVLAPVVYFAVEGNQYQVIGGLTVYLEAQSINFALNTVAKYAVRRPRPYTRHEDENVRRLHDCLTVEDDCLSFYSGHSSTAFTSAMAGGYLLNETFGPSQRAKMLTWGALMAAASATAHLRVRAGKHYYSDIVVGALIGSGIGLMVPLVHGGNYAPTAPELGAASTGLVVGALLPLLISADDLPNVSITPAILGSAALGLNVSDVW